MTKERKDMKNKPPTIPKGSKKTCIICQTVDELAPSMSYCPEHNYSNSSLEPKVNLPKNWGKIRDGDGRYYSFETGASDTTGWIDTFREFYNDNESGGSSRWLVAPNIVELFIRTHCTAAYRKGYEAGKREGLEKAYGMAQKEANKYFIDSLFPQVKIAVLEIFYKVFDALSTPPIKQKGVKP